MPSNAIVSKMQCRDASILWMASKKNILKYKKIEIKYLIIIWK